MNQPLISVIIPNFNRTLELKRAVESVLTQSYNNFELIIIDDGSDISPLPYIPFNDPRIRFIKLTQNRGAAQARNEGASKALGSYISFLDSDDEWLPDFLKNRIQIMNKNSCDGIYGAAKKYVNNQLVALPSVRELKKNESMITYLLSGTLRAVTSTLFIKKDAFLNILFDSSFIPHEDYVFNIEFHRKYKYLCDYNASTIYHATNDSLSQTIKDSSIKFLEKYGHELDFKWLFFFCVRKSGHALKNRENHFIQKYINIIQLHDEKASFFLRVNFYILRSFPKLYINSFNSLVKLAYSLNSYITKFKKG